MKLLLHLTRPKYFMPIHGELRMLKQHAHLAEQVGIPTENIAIVENGQVVEFENGKMSLGERIPGGYVFVDGSGVGDVSTSVMRERELLGRDGIVLVNLLVDKATGKLSQTPEIISRGFILPSDGEAIMIAMRKRIDDVVSRADGNLRGDIELSVKTLIYNETKRRPMVFVTLSKQ
jgi:ribonuclease J